MFAELAKSPPNKIIGMARRGAKTVACSMLLNAAEMK
jgi:hypothetical protein